MWRSIAIFLIGGICGTAFGIAATIFAYPFIFPPPAAMEQLAVSKETKPVATGTFIHANPSDPIHYGSGSVTVFENLVFLEDDFKVGPGPKYHVYLVPKAGIRKNSDLDEQMFIDLGRLRSFEGSQNYKIPDGVNLEDYQSVIIWCEQFGVLISPADLNFTS